MPITLGILATSAPSKVIATGGTTFDSGGYRYHRFLSSDTFTVTQGGLIEAIAIGGGGGGGKGIGGGGGGAGGLGFYSGAVTVGNHSVTIGAGGAIAPVNLQGDNGSNSALASFVTGNGGGGGGGSSSAQQNEMNGRDGGCGGGGGLAAGGLTGNGGGGSQGFNGGSSVWTGLDNKGTGGGGGMGGAGQDGQTNPPTSLKAGNGGIGTAAYSAWGIATFTGQSSGGVNYFAGGGAGEKNSGFSNLAGTGGLGGGGNSGSAGTANTGGGGSAANGGSGLVLVRYLL